MGLRFALAGCGESSDLFYADDHVHPRRRCWRVNRSCVMQYLLSEDELQALKKRDDISDFTRRFRLELNTRLTKIARRDSFSMLGEATVPLKSLLDIINASLDEAEKAIAPPPSSAARTGPVGAGPGAPLSK